MGDLANTVAGGNHRDSLVAMRDMLAAEADDVTWEKHKRECRCVCGMGDGRTRVALLKELRAVLNAIEALPEAEEGSVLDDLAAAHVDELAPRRAGRFADAAGS